MRPAAWVRPATIICLALSLVWSPSALLANEPWVISPGLQNCHLACVRLHRGGPSATLTTVRGESPLRYPTAGLDEVSQAPPRETELARSPRPADLVVQRPQAIEEVSAAVPWLPLPFLAVTLASTVFFGLLWHRTRNRARQLEQAQTSLRSQIQALQCRLDGPARRGPGSPDEPHAFRPEPDGITQHKLDFLSALGHELRTPLNSVLGFTEVLRGHPALVDVGAPSVYLDHIHNSGTHLARLVDDMLDLSRLESGHLIVEPTAVPIDLVLDQAIVTTTLLASEAGITVTNRISQPDALVQADATRLRQILINLLTNGIKYNRAGGSVEIVTDDAASPDRLQIEVIDTGNGISPDRVERVFEPFERLAPEQADGIGIGLALSKRLAERMGGRLGYRPAETGGSVFWLDLPRAGPASETGLSGVRSQPDPKA